ncbi:MAG: 2-dehydropantoate 2-reductase [Pseudomonadota bacterium]
MTNQQHLVFGTGLIGGYLAGTLIAQGFATHLLGRAKSRNDMASGLTIGDYLGNEASVPAPIFIDANESSNFEYDVIWLTVKCTAIESALETLGKLVTPQTTIICCQNGLGSDEPLRATFPNNPILTAVVGYNVAEPGPGHLHRSTEGKLVIESTELVDSIVAQLNCDLLPTVSSSEILAEQWAKLQLNLANPVNALADVPTKQMTETAGYRKIIAALMAELLMVTKAMNLSLPNVTALPGTWLPTLLRTPDWLYKKIAQKTLAIDPTARVSMWWDLQGKRRTEVDFLNGAVVAHGRALGLVCPVNEKIVNLIHEVEAGKREIGLSPEQMAELLGL